ncbi:MAG: transposase [Verrucomicrobia bacterium]|nr:transposase [Verrucomicrobiota bacterium]
MRELADGNAMLDATANPILAAHRALHTESLDLAKLLRDHAKSDPVCRQFMTMADLGAWRGAIVALADKSAIDDPDRFRSSKDVGPWAGLTPRREQSGERDIMGAISRAGDVGLRTVLYQAAMVMLNKGRPSWLTAWAWTVAKRRGKRRATVALARRIGVILHRMWQDGTEFRFKPAEAAVA